MSTDVDGRRLNPGDRVEIAYNWDAPDGGGRYARLGTPGTIRHVREHDVLVSLDDTATCTGHGVAKPGHYFRLLLI